MKQLIIKNARVVTADVGIVEGAVLVANGRISRIDTGGQIEAADGCAEFNADGAVLCPGFIDLHFHGLHNYLIDNGPADLNRICALLPSYGVTGFLPTVCPLPKGKDARFLSTLSAATADCSGAAVLGFHLEGPFLCLTGALPKEALGDDDQARVEKLIQAAAPFKAVFSISPEFPGITELLPLMTVDNTPAFITHTAATAEQALAAIAAGARHATHFYDVFPMLEVQEPGVRPCSSVEAVLATPGTSVDFILDGEHVNPVAVKVALRCLGEDNVCLITDANIGAGLGAGEYRFGDRFVTVARQGAPARLKGSGCLAGSGLTMNLAVRNAVDMLGVKLETAVKMASGNPARVLGLNARKGFIKEGYDADLVLMNDEFQIQAAWIGGERAVIQKS